MLDTLNVGATGNDGTGDPARVAGAKINAAIAEVNLLNPAVASATAGLSTIGAQVTANTTAIAANSAQLAGIPPAVPSGLTFAQLTNLYTAANITGTPNAVTSDQGICGWSPTTATWQPLTPYLLAADGIPRIYGPSGNITSTAGAFTFGTALDAAYSGYAYFHAGNIGTGVPNGWYWVVMSSTTVGQVYNNQYMFGSAQVPTTLVPFTTATVGAFTQVFTGLPGVQANVPGNGLGLNGELEYSYQWTCSNSANTKSVASVFAGTNIFGSDQETTVTSRSTRHLMRNRGATNSQIAFNSPSGDIGTGNGNITASIDTTVGQLATINLGNPTATDWIVLQSYSIKVFPSFLKDSPPTPAIYIPSTATPPQGAKALGYSHCKFLVFPTAADVSYSNNVASKLFAGLWYDSVPAYTTPHVTTVTLNGSTQLAVNYLGTDSVNPNVSTQTQNSTAGALPLLIANNGFYVEWASTLSDNAQDHFCSVYCLPTEHNTANGGTYPYVEMDADEGGNVIGGNYSFWGSANTVINWSGGSSGAHTIFNNLSAVSLYGPNIDRTKEHIFGMSYDPIGQVMAYWIDGQKQPFSPSTAAFNSTITGKNYYMIICPQSHGLNLPYTQYVRYFSAWSSV